MSQTYIPCPFYAFVVQSEVVMGMSSPSKSPNNFSANLFTRYRSNFTLIVTMRISFHFISVAISFFLYALLKTTLYFL